jgi:8-oxo-dGTP pyrophosphatase MutT (NUDIX family)
MKNKKVQVWVSYQKNGTASSSCVFLMLKVIEKRGSGWHPITGGVEKKDVDLLSAAIRETIEETGLLPVSGTFLMPAASTISNRIPSSMTQRASERYRIPFTESYRIPFSWTDLQFSFEYTGRFGPAIEHVFWLQLQGDDLQPPMITIDPKEHSAHEWVNCNQVLSKMLPEKNPEKKTEKKPDLQKQQRQAFKKIRDQLLCQK